MLDPTLLSALGDILPPSAIVATAEGTRAYECDGLTLFREQPLAVLLPENEAQVISILRLCHAARLPVVARGPRDVVRVDEVPAGGVLRRLRGARPAAGRGPVRRGGVSWYDARPSDHP